MQFSLIVATINRVDTLDRLLESLDGQIYTDFEVIIADQNSDQRVMPLVERYAGGLHLRHCRVRPGLSAARNEALAMAKGAVVAFPDDDCWYLPETLSRIDALMQDHADVEGLSVACCDGDGRPSVQNWPREPVRITPRNVWRRAVSIGLFIRREEVRSVGGFDESLGAGSGSPWGSGEETDLVLRLLSAGVDLDYLPELLVGHANPTDDFDAAAGARALAYGRGLGRVLAKHRRPLDEKALVLLRPACGAVLAGLKGQWGRSRYYRMSFRGRWQGLRGAHKMAN
ncbi:MAG: glycosyltransferase family 2 protein [Phycisphaerae bacterium]